MAMVVNLKHSNCLVKASKSVHLILHPNKGSIWVTSRGIDIARPDGYGWIRFKNEMSTNGYDVQLTGDNNRLEIRTAQTGGVWVSEAGGAYYKLGPAGATVPVLPGAGEGLYYTGTTLNVDPSQFGDVTFDNVVVGDESTRDGSLHVNGIITQEFDGEYYEDEEEINEDDFDDIARGIVAPASTNRLTAKFRIKNWNSYKTKDVPNGQKYNSDDKAMEYFQADVNSDAKTPVLTIPGNTIITLTKKFIFNKTSLSTVRVATKVHVPRLFLTFSNKTGTTVTTVFGSRVVHA